MVSKKHQRARRVSSQEERAEMRLALSRNKPLLDAIKQYPDGVRAKFARRRAE